MGSANEESPPAAQEAPIIEVTALASDGAGVARLPDGRVVFVEGAVPGDRVVVGRIDARKRALRTVIARLVSPSPDRITPRCAHFGDCGGCQWQHVRYAAQLEAKRRNVRAALERIGGLTLPGELTIVASPDDYAYRARTRVVETAGGLGYRRRGSHEAFPVDSCPVLVPAVQAAFTRLADRGARRPTREWTITAGTSGSARVHAAGSNAGSEPLPGPVVLEVLGERLELTGPGFVQGNALLWDALAGAVRALCLAPNGERRPRRFVELYAGIGFLTLPLARAGLAGIAVESDGRAVADLVANLERAGLAGQVEAVASPAEDVRALARWFAEADLLLVDPPRIGLAERVRESIAASGPATVVYVSCDPATLARDLRVLVARGYRLESVTAFDLFPQTPHVETVVRLVR